MSSLSLPRYKFSGSFLCSSPSVALEFAFSFFSKLNLCTNISFILILIFHFSIQNMFPLIIHPSFLPFFLSSTHCHKSLILYNQMAVVIISHLLIIFLNIFIHLFSIPSFHYFTFFSIDIFLNSFHLMLHSFPLFMHISFSSFPILFLILVVKARSSVCIHNSKQFLLFICLTNCFILFLFNTELVVSSLAIF